MSSTRTTRSTVVRAGDGLALTLERARLLLVAGPDQGLEFFLPERRVLVGRGDRADLRLSDRTVSREHLAIEPRDRGFGLRDLGSKSGSLLNGTRVDIAPLEPGARISLGETEMVFRTGEATVAAPPRRESVFEGMLGESLAMRRVFGLIERVAALDLPVLIRGESGTGKEGLARAVHLAADPTAPFEVVDCTLLEREHLRSELFGHVKGAFTGADTARKGAFERANHGAVFFDEVGELPLDLQPALLRVLEVGEVRPLGGDHTLRVRTRLVSATNRDLEAMVAAGNFREDLYYRLSAVVVEVPPLRERGEDVLQLAEHFLGGAATLAATARHALLAYPWPGNVRELKFKLQRAMALAGSRELTSEDLGLSLPPAPLAAGPAGGSIADYEEAAIREALRLFEGNRNLAARHLGIGRSTLYRRLKSLGLE